MSDDEQQQEPNELTQENEDDKSVTSVESEEADDYKPTKNQNIKGKKKKRRISKNRINRFKPGPKVIRNKITMHEKVKKENDMDDLDNENASAHSFNKDNDKLVNKNASKNVRSVDASRQT